MINTASISRTVYVHDIDNPPYSGHSMHVEIILTNGNHFEISNLLYDHQTSFTMAIKNSKLLGLTSISDNEIENFFDKVMLAFNLVMRSASFSRNKSDSSSAVLKLEPMSETTSNLTKDEQGNVKVVISETIGLRDSVHITGAFKEEINELRVLQILEKLVKLDSLIPINGIQIQDLKKSLDDYEHATSAFDRLAIFKNLFELENCFQTI